VSKEQLQPSDSERIGGLSVYAIVLLIAAVLLLFTNLHNTSLPTNDDTYHAQTAKEMLASGDWIGIRFGGHLSFQSSPLPAWLMSASFAAFGVNEFAARLPMAVCGLLTIMIVFQFVRHRWGEQTALLAVGILLLNSMFVRYARNAMAESPLALMTTLAVIFAWKGVEEDRRGLLWAGFFSGLAILTKSALGALPVLAVIIWLLLSRRWDVLFSRTMLYAALLMFAVVLIWYGPALLMYGEAFIDSHLGAYLGTHAVAGHHVDAGVSGFFYYIIRFPLEFLPWSLLLIPALALSLRDFRRSNTSLLFAICVVLPLLILTFVSTKYSRYLVQIIPIAAVLCAIVLANRIRFSWLAQTARVLTAVSLVVALAAAVLPFSFGEDRNAAIRESAPAIEANAHEEYELLNYRLDFWQYQSPSLFYADRAISPPMESPQAIKAAIPEGIRRAGLVNEEHQQELATALQGVYQFKILARSEDLICFEVGRMGRSDWLQEARLIARELELRQLQRTLGTWNIDVKGPVRRAFKQNTIQLVPGGETIRATYNRMLSREIHHGIVLRDSMTELINASGNIFNVDILLMTDYLVLFRVERSQLAE